MTDSIKILYDEISDKVFLDVCHELGVKFLEHDTSSRRLKTTTISNEDFNLLVLSKNGRFIFTHDKEIDQFIVYGKGWELLEEDSSEIL
jgi:hypothetical protein